MKFTSILEQIDYELLEYRKLTGIFPSNIVLDIVSYHKLKEELELPMYLYLSRFKGMRILVVFTEETFVEFL